MTDERTDKLIAVLESIDKSLKEIAETLRHISQNRPAFKKPASDSSQKPT